MQKKILIGILIIAILAVAYLWGGNAPESELAVDPVGTEVPLSEVTTAEPTEVAEKTETATTQPSEIPTEPPTEPPTGPPTEVPSDAPRGEEKFTCTLSVNCSTVLSNMEFLKAGKEAIIPPNGVILPPTEAIFFEGENVFQVLRRTLKEKGVHLEFTNTPIYNTAYIEGIGNLYEFDCGELSGWVYRVNGSFPGYGCSRYGVENGDRIEFLYTCNLGEDVGGNNIAK